MSSELDLRENPVESQYEQLADAFNSEKRVSVLTDRDLSVTLTRYQIEYRRELDWEPMETEGGDRRVTIELGEEIADDNHLDFDVRSIPPQRRHTVLTETFDSLDPAQGFILVNDHDPKPLFHELRSLYGDVVGWQYESRGGADGWRVEITKTDAATGGDSDVHTRFDVREIPKSERHEMIHHRFGMLPNGAVLEIVAPHEPRPLKSEFEGRYDEFQWDVVESNPEECRVRITKGESESEDSNLTVGQELDVRDLPPAKRHERIFEAYDELEEGIGFILVNDHDPKPLYHQFEAEAGPEFFWEYQQESPGEFRVLIGKSGEESEHTHSEAGQAPF